MLTLVCLFVAILLAVFFPKSKKTALIISLLLAVIAICNYQNNDFTGYETQYNNIQLLPDYYGDTVGYRLLVYLAQYINLSFIQFRNLLLIIGLYLTYKSVCAISEFPSLILGILIPFPYFYNIVQFRFFFASSIAVYALVKLKNKFNNRKCVIEYIIVILLCSLIHKSIYFFLIYILLVMNINLIKKVCISITCIGFILAISGFVPLIANVLIGSLKATAYFEKQQGLGAVLAVLVVVINIIILNLLYNQVIRTQQSSYVQNSRDIIKIGFCTLPLSILLWFDVSSIFRLYRCMLLLFYSYDLNVVTIKKISIKDRFLILFIILIWFIFIMMFGFTMHNFAETFTDIIQYNYISNIKF